MENEESQIDERFMILLEAARKMPSGQQDPFLRQACQGDSRLLSAVQQQLQWEERMGNFLLDPLLRRDCDGSLAAPDVATSSSLQAGQTFVERFRLVRMLGEGGMGQVWLADQLSPIQRPVALKLIRAGMYDDSMVRRFHSERQLLAMMNHPAIAKVLDAGTTPQGQPYFVMEYVPGQPITDYCDQKKLRIADRLALFNQVCDGIQHAHQKAILHRDLKPANILVVEVDGKPFPRIIDFGLARLLTPTIVDQSILTSLGHFAGTPAFMSPEQADPETRDIDTRTDVYSLGAVLYVLLSGFQPFDRGSGGKIPIDELLRRLREEVPLRPSSKVGANRNKLGPIPDVRGTECRQLVSRLRGELDWIVMKAMEKDRARRYGAPSELAADIRRYLNHDIVVARPASAAYRLRKYVRRHRFGVSVTASALTMLVAFSVLQTVQLRRVMQERDRANRITSFMTEMFKVSDPSEAHGNSVTAREILDRASTRIDTGMAQDQQQQARMMHVMGVVYSGLGLYAEAEKLLDRAVDIRRRILGPQNRETVESMIELSRAVGRQGRFSEVEKLQREVLEIRRRTLGPESADTIASISQLANTLSSEGHFAEADGLAREVLEIRRRMQGPDNPVTMESTQYLAMVLTREGKSSEAEVLDRRLLDWRRGFNGPNHPEVIAAEFRLGSVLYQEGKLAEAVPLVEDAVETGRRVLGVQHPFETTYELTLAGLWADQGHYAQAEKLQRDVLEMRRNTQGPDNSATLNAMANLGQLLTREGYYSEAEELLRKAIEVSRRTVGPVHPLYLWAMAQLSITLDREGRHPEAEKLAQESTDGMTHTLGPDQPDTLNARAGLAEVLWREGHYGDAEKLYRDEFAIRRRILGSHDPGTPLAESNLAHVLSREGRLSEADQLQREALNTQSRSMGPQNADTLRSQSTLARILVEEGHYTEAEALARKTLAIQVSELGPEYPDAIDTLQQLAVAMVYSHRYPEASKLFRNTIAKRRQFPGLGSAYQAWYSFACVAAAANRKDDALRYLQEAIYRGYRDAGAIVADNDLKKLHQNVQFRRLIARLESTSAKVQAP